MKKALLTLALICMIFSITVSVSEACDRHDRRQCNFEELSWNAPLIWIQGIELMVVYRGQWHTVWLETESTEGSVTDVKLPWDTRTEVETLTDDFHIILKGRCLRVVDLRWGPM